MGHHQAETDDKPPDALEVSVRETSSVGESFRVDFRFAESYYELWCLAEYLDVLQRQLCELRKRERTGAYARLAKMQLDHAEFAMEQRQVDEILDRAFPRLIFNPFLVALWGVLESTVTDVAKYLKDTRDSGLDITDLRERGFLARAKKYFEHVLKFPLADTKPEQWRRAKMLEVLRNALCHANGRLEAIDCRARHKIECWRKENIGVATDERYVYCSEQFVRSTYEAVKELLNDLLERATASS